MCAGEGRLELRGSAIMVFVHVMDSQEPDIASFAGLQEGFQPFEIAVCLESCGTAYCNALFGKRLHALFEHLDYFGDG